jgi:hypothetical protein
MNLILTKTWKTAVLTIAFFLMVCSAAHAHRFHAAISDISMNVHTGNTEIIHTFMTHDVESLLENLYQRQFDLEDPEDVALFRKYLEKQFSISNSKNEAYPLKWIGLKVDPNYVMVYQEIEKQALPEKLTIRQAVLTDFLADQINTLNFSRADKQLKSYSFDRQNREQNLP